MQCSLYLCRSRSCRSNIEWHSTWHPIAMPSNQCHRSRALRGLSISRFRWKANGMTILDRLAVFEAAPIIALVLPHHELLGNHEAASPPQARACLLHCLSIPPGRKRGVHHFEAARFRLRTNLHWLIRYMPIIRHSRSLRILWLMHSSDVLCWRLRQ